MNRKLNVWYDHGVGKGGNLVDFGVLFYGCSVAEFLQKLEGKWNLNLSFHLPIYGDQAVAKPEEKKLIVRDVKPIKSLQLIKYLSKRNIDLKLAKQFLKEVSFALNGKPFTALGFQNKSGGFELRNEHFKGSSSPKDATLFDNKSDNITVFEGCFSFLSYLSLYPKMGAENMLHLPEGQTNFLILNSLSFFEKSRSIMENHNTIQLYLDRDAAGIKATEQALQWSSKYRDSSSLYKEHKDLNDYLKLQQSQCQRLQLKQSLRRGRHL